MISFSIGLRSTPKKVFGSWVSFRIPTGSRKSPPLALEALAEVRCRRRLARVPVSPGLALSRQRVLQLEFTVQGDAIR